MSIQTRTSQPIYGLLPIEVDGFDMLAELALNMRWCWNHATDPVWRRLDPKLWEDVYKRQIVQLVVLVIAEYLLRR